MSQIWMSCVPHMSESCPTYEWVMSHIWMRHGTHINPNHVALCSQLCPQAYIHIGVCVCEYVCVYVCMSGCVHIHINTHKLFALETSIFAREMKLIQGPLHSYIYTYLRTCIYIYIYMYMCIHKPFMLEIWVFVWEIN